MEYIDETLPVLRVMDLLSNDEMAARDPTFLGVDDAQVLNDVYEFFPGSEKARGFAKLWRKLITKSPDTSVRLLLDLARSRAPNYRDDAETVERILAIQDAGQRKSELERNAYPYVAANAPEGGNGNGTSTSTVRLSELAPPVEVCDPPLKITAFDAIYQTQTVPVIGVKDDEETRMFNARETKTWRAHVRKFSKARRARVLERISSATYGDVTELEAALAQHGISYDSLRARELNPLLMDWDEAPPQTRPSARPRVAINASHLDERYPIWAAFDDYVNADIDVEKEQEQLARRIEGIEVIPYVSSLLPFPLTLRALDYALENGSDVVLMMEAYREMIKNDERKAAREMLEGALQALQSYDEWSVALAAEVAKHERYFKHDADTVRMPAFADEKDAVAGTDLVGYVGTLATQPQQEPDQELGQEPDQEPDQESEVPFDSATYALPDNIINGQREILLAVVPDLMQLAKRTNLPLDIDTVIALTHPYLTQTTRLQQLDEALEHALPEEHLTALLADPDIADWYLAADQKARVKKALALVQDAFRANVRDAFARALGTWVVLLQEMFADRRGLDYKPPAALASCASLWGFHGPPMTLTKGRGVMTFLLCVHNPSDKPEARATSINEVVEQMHPERVQALRDQFQDFKEVLVAQREQLKEEQAELKRFLEGNGTVARFMSGLLQLPRVLAAQERRARGCCAQALGDEYKAYADWASNRALRGLRAQMTTLRAIGVSSQSAPLGFMQINKDESTAAAKNTIADIACVHKENLYTTQFTELQSYRDAWRLWLPPSIATLSASSYVSERLDVIARATRNTSVEWIKALSTATYEDLLVLASALRPPTDGINALRMMRTHVPRPQDEERVLDLAKVLIATWAASGVSDFVAQAFQKFASSLLTSAQLVEKISELRERQKESTLHALNSKDPEMRKLLTQMKKIGVASITADAQDEPHLDAPQEDEYVDRGENPDDDNAEELD